MATVYLAEDLKHHRKVALKVLKPELAAVVGADRFLAEIDTTAHLQHPNILPLFDSGEADGFVFFVMPYVEDETLRERLDREKQLPVEDAVRIASEVAEALDYAHRKGIVHRDIKPANILLREGRPLVADFGIALAASRSGGGERLTETGMSLGTPYYMSPEQATGDQPVGPATDIYALGCVLYEMLVGEPPYPGSTAQAVLGKIIQGKPMSAKAARSSVPPNVDAAIRKTLEKLPADRFLNARDFAEALDDPSFRQGEDLQAATREGHRRWRTVAVVATVLAVLSTVAVIWLLSQPTPAPPVTRFELVLPESVQIARGVGLEVSPDGSRFIFVGVSPEGETQLWQRTLDDLTPEPIPGTADAVQISFSPDGSAIAFTVDGNLRTMSLVGLPPQTLPVNSARGGGLDWGPDGWIYYRNSDRAIWRVSTAGGEPEQITAPTSEGESHYVPSLLPNGRGMLYTIEGGDETLQVALLDIETRETHRLLRGAIAGYVESGYLVYQSPEGTSLLAAPFDTERLEVTGPSRTVLEGAFVDVPAQFALSRSGTLAYVPDRGIPNLPGGAVPPSQLVWVDRSGNEQPVDTNMAPRGFHFIELSPDDERLAVSISEEGRDEIWVKELPDGPLTRLTVDPGPNTHPWGWSRDGSTIVYTSDADGTSEVRSVRADGGAVGNFEVLLEQEADVIEAHLTRDERGLVVVEEGDEGRNAAFVDLETGAGEGLLTSTFREWQLALSPDGRWLAYVSDVSGRDEVYVRPFPSVEGGRWQVSRNGGVQPIWAPAGSELFYREPVTGFGSTGSGGGRLLVATYTTDPRFSIQSREVLFDSSQYTSVSSVQSYDVVGDGERFMMMRPVGPSGDEVEPPRLVVVQNFFEELRQLTRE